MQIRKHREAKGLSQKEVAEKVGVDVSTVTKWETGIADPRAKQIPVLADLFCCTIDELYGRETSGEETAEAS